MNDMKKKTSDHSHRVSRLGGTIYLQALLAFGMGVLHLYAGLVWAPAPGCLDDLSWFVVGRDSSCPRPTSTKKPAL